MKILTSNWYEQLKKDLVGCKRLRVISPYVSSYFFNRIRSEFDLSNIELITRFNLQDFAAGASDIDALKLLVDNNAKVYGIKDLHSKIYIIDEKVAIVTSANLTRRGLHTNYECGIRIESKNEIFELNTIFNHLSIIATKNRFSQDKYDKWQSIIKNLEIHNDPNRKLEDYGSNQELNKIDETKTYYVKFFGTANNREGLNFPVKEEINRALCHYACGFSEKKKPRQINSGDIIYFARLTKNPNNYSIFGRGIAVKYDEERDRASEKEIIERPWKKDWPVYLRVKNTSFVDGTLGDCTLMNKLIDELDYMAFSSTKSRFENGERDINPKRSLSQQPYIKLSNEGAKWVEANFYKDVIRSGKVEEEFLNSLPDSW